MIDALSSVDLFPNLLFPLHQKSINDDPNAQHQKGAK